MRVAVRALSLAIACGGALLAMGDVALASECHANCDGGYLAMLGLVGGGLALGSSALGLRLGGSVPRGSAAHTEEMDRSRLVWGADDVKVEPREAMAPEPQPVDAAKVVNAASDYGGRLIQEMAPHGQKLGSALDIVEKVVASEDRAAGAAQGLSDVAVNQLKDTVRSAATFTPATPPADALASPAVGTTPKYCAQCGSPTREGGRFCGRCGNRL